MILIKLNLFCILQVSNIILRLSFLEEYNYGPEDRLYKKWLPRRDARTPGNVESKKKRDVSIRRGWYTASREYLREQYRKLMPRPGAAARVATAAIAATSYPRQRINIARNGRLATADGAFPLRRLCFGSTCTDNDDPWRALFIFSLIRHCTCFNFPENTWIKSWNQCCSVVFQNCITYLGIIIK